jgi:subtilisin-like proprotein convertase family protein
MPAPIEDDYAATAVAFVYEAPGPITDVNVTVRIAHTYDSDLDLYLVSPSRQRVHLAQRVGGFKFFFGFLV